MSLHSAFQNFEVKRASRSLRIAAGEPSSARGPAGELLSARGSHWMVLTPLRESHSARGNPRIYAPKRPSGAISPGGSLPGGWRARPPAPRNPTISKKSSVSAVISVVRLL